MRNFSGRTLRYVIALLLLCCLTVGSAAQQPRAGDDQPPEWLTRPVRAPGVQYHTFYSHAAKSGVSYHVYLPQQYEAEPQRRFPVLYWLHGGGGGPLGIPHVSKFFGNAMAAGNMPPMCIVFVNGLPGGMWCDSKDGKTPIETIVITELVPHIDATFRTIASRDGRLIEGWSMGGYGAARLGFKYHEIFGAISMLGAGPLQLDFLRTGPRVKKQKREWILQTIFGGDLDYFGQQSPWRLAELNTSALQADMLIRQVIGDLDETLDINCDFHEHLLRLEIEHTFVVLPGVGHNAIGVLEGLGNDNWEFYRALLSNPDA